jgi:hypothetical protein
MFLVTIPAGRAANLQSELTGNTALTEIVPRLYRLQNWKLDDFMISIRFRNNRADTPGEI